jgi:hypothetical protein
MLTETWCFSVYELPSLRGTEGTRLYCSSHRCSHVTWDLEMQVCELRVPISAFLSFFCFFETGIHLCSPCWPPTSVSCVLQSPPPTPFFSSSFRDRGQIPGLAYTR